MKKRLAVFVFYDNEGIVDRYVTHLLKCLKTVCERIIVISNVAMTQSEQDKFQEYSSELLFRENKGYDVGAYQEVIVDYLGVEKLCQYDELVLMNDTIYGPFIPLSDIFEEMENRKCDFWGITKQAKTYVMYGKIDDNIQSYFLVFNKPVLCSDVFKEYWKNTEIPNNFMEACMFYENKMTKLLETAGFRGDTFVHSDIFDTRSAKTNFNHFAYLMGTLVEKYNMPFLKKKPFVLYDFVHSSQMELRRALNYIKEKTEYNTELIWESILRKYSIDILTSTIGLNEILIEEGQSEYRPDVAVIVYVETERTFLWIQDIIMHLRKNIDFYFVCSSSEVQRMGEKYSQDINLILDEKANYSNALFITNIDFNRYKYLCYFHDDPIIRGKESLSREYIYLNETAECLLGNLKQVIDLFETEKCLGIAKSPDFIFSKYWNQKRRHCYKNAVSLKKFAKDNHIYDLVNWNGDICSIENGFWCIAETLQTIKNKYKDYEALYYLLPYIVQKEKKYTITIMSKRIAQNRISNLEHVANELKEIYVSPDFRGVYIQTSGLLKRDNAINKMKRYKRIFVYGAGEIAKREIPKLKRRGVKINNIIVSRLDRTYTELEGINIVELSDRLQLSEEDCVILALNTLNQLEVIPNLSKYIELDQIFAL